jgi:hypothetical protein
MCKDMKNLKTLMVILILVVFAVVLSSNTVSRTPRQEMCFYPYGVAVNAVNEKISNGYKVVSVVSSNKPTYDGLYVLFEKEY